MCELWNLHLGGRDLYALDVCVCVCVCANPSKKYVSRVQCVVFFSLVLLYFSKNVYLLTPVYYQIVCLWGETRFFFPSRSLIRFVVCEARECASHNWNCIRRRRRRWIFENEQTNNRDHVHIALTLQYSKWSAVVLLYFHFISIHFFLPHFGSVQNFIFFSHIFLAYVRNELGEGEMGKRANNCWPWSSSKSFWLQRENDEAAHLFRTLSFSIGSTQLLFFDITKRYQMLVSDWKNGTFIIFLSWFRSECICFEKRIEEFY